ncbi:MAG: hypothetical protein HY544_03385 [Candidatus Diapherotrites archaeon]|uniref:Uncharacterized protein n=1 Tax=Candidatus Iainarchaeum sp. TaxID=3101447 RepID=A0A8T3YP03_9ARCH|nr:hypothetical protein [Candidatus Diapherotrites archaeon]
MKLLADEKAQVGTESLIAIAIAVVAAIGVGYYLKTFVTNKVQPEVNEKLS